jgi:molybdenum cofactor cytidylyltransferase
MKTQPVVIVLAAGLGSRYKGPRHKLAETLGAESVLACTLRQVLASGLELVLVTTSALQAQAVQVLAERDIVWLPEVSALAPTGMGVSIAAGVAARSAAAGWLVLPADMPLVQPQTLRAVSDALGHHAVAYAQYRGRRGHPVAFGAELYSDLMHLRGDEGARRLVARYPACAVEVDDPGVLQDVDTEADLAALRAQLGALAGNHPA